LAALCRRDDRITAMKKNVMSKAFCAPAGMLLALCGSLCAPLCAPLRAQGAAAAPHNPDMRPLAAQVDTNHDGRMSRAEWRKAGLPMSSFNGFEKGRGYVTLRDYQTHPAPPGIDLNGDGKVTVAEFRAFDRQMSARMRQGKGKGPAPAPAAR
jgi:hypothetical protein